MASSFKRLYNGLTSTLMVRVAQHIRKADPESFTARYSIDRLVYFERFSAIHRTIARAKELKNWHRVQKIQLIVAANPGWRDLSEDWGKPVEPFCEEQLRPPRRFGE